MGAKCWFMIVIILLGGLILLSGLPCYAQRPEKTHTILYSNNLNGEIDPCPT